MSLGRKDEGLHSKMRISSYRSFSQNIHKLANENSLPLRMMFELTYRCNFRCKHCYIPSARKNNQRKELKTREVFLILEQLKDLGCLYLGFTGGEIFLRDDIADILTKARKCGFLVILYTNASLIDDKMARFLQGLALNKVDITLHGMSPVVFDRVSGVPGSHGMVFRAIDLLLKRGVNVGFKSCVLKANAAEIPDVLKYARSLGLPCRLDDMLFPSLDGSMDVYRFRGKLKSRLAVGRWHEECRDAASAGRGGEKNIFKCGAGRTQAAISPSGELKMCVMIDYPGYKILKYPATEGPGGDHLGQAWKKLRNAVSGIKPDENYQCDACGLAAHCKWCPARSWLYRRNFTSCDPLCREFASKGAESDTVKNS